MYSTLSKQFLQITIAFLICTGAAWGQDWGGTSLRTAADMDVAEIRSAPYTDTNFGVTVASGPQNGNPATQEIRNLLVRMTADPHTGGYTQDICTLFVYVTASTDSGTLYGYVLRQDWGEGAGNSQTAQAGECSWNAAFEGTTDWTTAGAQSTTNDRQATVACSVYIPNGHSASYLAMEIDGSHLTQDFFDFGLVVTFIAPTTFKNTEIITDDNGVETNRPYFSGYETAGATPALNIGPTAIGASNLAPPQ